MPPKMLDTDHGIPVTVVGPEGDGLLWLINRVVFHPRGFALAAAPDGSWWLLGDGSECIRYAADASDDAAEDRYFARVEALFARARSSGELRRRLPARPELGAVPEPQDGP